MDDNQVMFKDRCFADAGEFCTALNAKECRGCNFYKPMDKYIYDIVDARTKIDKSQMLWYNHKCITVKK